MRETWKPVPGTDGWYDVSNLGEVRSWIRPSLAHGKFRAEKPKIMCPWVNHRSAYVRIAGEAIRVKDLVRDVFLGGKQKGLVLRHKDGDPTNCSVYNLEFVTKAQINKERRNPNSRTVAKMEPWGKVIEFYPSARDAARKNYLSTSGLIGRIKRKSIIDGVWFKYID